MSRKKRSHTSIQLSHLLKPDGEIDELARDPGSGGGVVMNLSKHRNIEILMGEGSADPALRVALTKELLIKVDTGAKFTKGRTPGAKATKTKYIHKLRQQHPDLTAKGLYKLADKKIIGTMSPKTFENHLSQL